MVVTKRRGSSDRPEKLNGKTGGFPGGSRSIDEDIEYVHAKLTVLDSLNTYQLTLDIDAEDSTPMIVCLQRRLDQRTDHDPELQFFSHTLQLLNAYNGFEVEVENWMITAYEVEFGQKIGFGGLYAFLRPNLVLTTISPLSISVERFLRAFGTVLMLQLKFSRRTVVSVQAQKCVSRPLHFA